MEMTLEELVARLQALLQRRRFRSGRGGRPGSDPSRGQGRLLAMLKVQDGISTKDLAYILGIRPASLNELLVKLEKSGLVVREQSETDRRVWLVKLTEQGRAEVLDAEEESAFATLSAEEQQSLRSCLSKVIGALEDELGVGPDNPDEWMEHLRERMGDQRFERWAGHLEDKFGPEWIEHLRTSRRFDRGPRRRFPR
jgi:DNA-binding MarR family transcriptional regulator